MTSGDMANTSSPERVPDRDLREIEPFYFFPYRHVAASGLNGCSSWGAGNGNDVAVARGAGAQHVDAVEIDPVGAVVGRRYHPDDPYADPRVSVHINDGRAFNRSIAARLTT